MNYLVCKITCLPEYGEILMAELADIGFDSFMESPQGIEAYIQEGTFDQAALDEVIAKYAAQTALSVVTELMPRINWNEEWEKNYDPIMVGKQVYVRASFHPERTDFAHEIIINPKMSFGTGHHATTHLMLEFLLELDLAGKTVLDVGSGTGILAIMAHKMGATTVEAFDIDDWCVDNGNENFTLNGLHDLKMGLGTIREVSPSGPYDVILANINKNVLLDEMGQYASILSPTGMLLISGFYEHDIPDIMQKAQLLDLKINHQRIRNNWAAIALKKTV
ncbi:50S ribosomal protein L11 methyltransferase [Lunatibacter salilacus]|uniref:50S ribosomal protein L11 methyltransferase n=1 Tax=Lunatibacter salilacus TaxID=2483804 RepID=UPI00131CAE41|nr:50S ribosomal protein L11 methyltransferase [Lunatibacter salilacus]